MTVVSLFIGFYQVSKNRIALFLKKPCILKIKTYLCTRNTEVAQLVEHWSPKPGVGSSSLSFRAEAIQLVSLFLFPSPYLLCNYRILHPIYHHLKQKRYESN